MSINVIDIIAVASVLLIALLSAKRGFFKVLINFAAYFFSYFAAKFSATPVAEFIYDKFIRLNIMNYIEQILPDGKAVNLTINDILPESITKIASFFNMASVDAFIDGLNSALAPENIESSYIKPIVFKILLLVVTVVLFFVFSLLLGLFARWLNKILFKKKKGIISTFNKVLGFVFGLLKGCIPVLAICEVLNLIASVSSNTLITDTVANSYICSFISKLIL